MMHLHIFTLTWNGLDKLTKLKDSLLPCLNDINYTWYIKDNGSSDNTVETASLWGKNIKVIAYKNNLQNFSEGMNFLFKESCAQDEDLILLLNNDVIFNGTNSIKNMMNIIKDSSVGVVGAKLKYTGTNKLQHSGVVFNKIGMPMHFRANEPEDKLSDKDREFQAVTGAVMLTKAKYYKNICKDNKSGISGLPESLAWAFEDIYACLSIKYEMNKKIIYCGSTDIFHEESSSLKKNPLNKLFMTQNKTLFLNKWQSIIKKDSEEYMKNNKIGVI